MTFNSYTFIIFFVIVLILHNLPFSWRVKKTNLLLASYVFYAAWNPPFVLLLWFSTLVDWTVGWALGREERPARRRLLLCVSLMSNFGLLGFFKYGGFLTRNFLALTHAMGLHYQLAAPSIVLPVGISFYTFQTLSYALDIYYRKMKPWHSFLDYAMYVTFFPMLVAGPIVRAGYFLPQCEEPRRATRQQLAWGLSLLLLGLFEKVVLADGILAPVADHLFVVTGIPTWKLAWAGTLAFSGQIFCDFAGYSTCAIGAALCFGFVVPVNFRFPYAAIGFSDFWRRWHVSLSSWLRDYLYIPLGGNRKGSARTYVNLMLTMLLGGLWHGASWTFVIWGGMHGSYLMAERGLRRYADMPLWRPALVRLGLGMGTFGLVCLTWVFFRSASLGQALTIVGAMFKLNRGIPSLGMVPTDMVAVGVVFAMLAVHWLMRDHTLVEVVNLAPWWLTAGTMAVMLFMLSTWSGVDRAFIYFQF